MVHGGAWRIGDKTNHSVIKTKVRRWVKQGWVVISVNYRLIPAADPYTQAEDVAKALSYVQNHGAEWGTDVSKIILMGHSSGAHLVSLLASDKSLGDKFSLKPVLGSVWLDSAALDVTKIMQNPHSRFYDKAFGDSADYWRKVSAIEHLHTDVKPIALICSTQRDDSCPQAKALADKATQLTIHTNIISVDLSHHQINATLGDNTPYTWQVEDFMRSLDPSIKQYLKPSP
jgi:acetyl esterase/lipase